MLCPDVAVTTDIIVGFPGETTKDFDDTMELIKTVGYDSLFVFKYSDRPNAPAAHFPNKVPESEKQHRLEQVLALQEQITSTINKRLIGSKVMVLVDNHSKMNEKMASAQWSGRTSTNKVVNFSVDAVGPKVEHDLLGWMIPVEIQKALAHSLWGKAVGSMQRCNNLKGEKCYAA
jgi:tRNA-2-methylthio-N6-dimethylallyladenosine synthase